MARDYICLYHSYLDAIQALGDAERGRLLTAMLEYSVTGAAGHLGGNERFIFPMIKAQIDRDIKKYDDICAKNSEKGKLGGRPPKAEKATGFQESKKSQGKDEEKDKDKGKGEEDAQISAITCTHKFVPPTVDEVRQYVHERSLRVDPQRFIDFYAAKGWMIGKNKMKDWKAACRNAERWELFSQQKPLYVSSVHTQPPQGELLCATEWMKDFIKKSRESREEN